MLIVACQSCGATKILAGGPDPDGVARATWCCSSCGTGQVLQLSVSHDAAGGDLRDILGGLALSSDDADVTTTTDDVDAFIDVNDPQIPGVGFCRWE